VSDEATSVLPTVTTTAMALHNEEAQRTRLFIRFGWVISIATIGIVPLLPSPRWMQIMLIAALVWGMVLSFYFHQAFADPRRFRPEKMLVIVYQRALAAYVSRVLPSLDVEGVPVMTFGSWAESARRAAFPLLDVAITDETPPVVMRAKAHGAFLRIIDDRQAALAEWCRARLAADLGDKAEAAAALAF